MIRTATTDSPLTLDSVRDMFDWDAVASPVLFDHPSTGAGPYPFPGKQVIFHEKTGHPFGVTSTGYSIHQYRDWLGENVASLLDDSDLIIERAGLLKEGAVAFVQARFPQDSQVGDVVYHPWISAVSSHDGTFATTYLAGSTIMVCENTVRAAIQEAKKEGSIVRIKHTRQSGFRIAEARAALGVLFKTDDTFAAIVGDLLRVKVTNDVFDEMVKDFVGTPDPRSKRSVTMAQKATDALHNLWEEDERAATWAGTGFGVFQAFNTYGQHVRSVKGVDREERNALNALSGKDGSGNLVERILAMA